MIHTKRSWIVCCVALLCVMAIAVGCTPEQPTETPVVATPQATAEPTAEPTPEATLEPTPEATATAEPIIYTEEEIAAAKKVVETYCTDEEITASSIEYDEDYQEENEMRFYVAVMDSKDNLEVIVVRANTTSDWELKPSSEE